MVSQGSCRASTTEFSSDDESFVSTTEMPYADPSIAEIYKAHEPDSDPLETRVTRSKSKSLNIYVLIKDTEMNASSSDFESDAETSSDAPRGLVTAVNKPESNSRRLKSTRL
jgi:hypothetical protein